MGRYLKAILGGFLALLAAFGWTVAAAFFISWKYNDVIVGVRVRNGIAFWILPFLIFAAGFYFAFRSTYGQSSK